jgi:1,4-dihydroxy-2-naphthoyl-CoA hydrolase
MKKSTDTNKANGGLLPANALNPTARENCERILGGGMSRSLDFRITAIKPRRITAEMPLSDRHMNSNGRVNGGALMAFADMLGAVGAAMHRPAGYRGGTLESKTNFFSSGVGPALTAVCIPLHIGRTTSVWQTTISGSDGRKVAMVTQTQMALPGRAESSGSE